MKKYFISNILGAVLLTFGVNSFAQDIAVELNQFSALDKVYGEVHESDELLTMNDLDIEFGYALYTTKVEQKTDEQVTLRVENVRDYATVYLDNKYVGSLTFENNSMQFQMPEGSHSIALYAENIGRITYGPEILDNSKGLFGEVTLQYNELIDWEIIPLDIRAFDVSKLDFATKEREITTPVFHQGSFAISEAEDMHLDMTGWGMGEVWINNNYLGAFSEREAQRSIPVTADVMKVGDNKIVIFELKNNNANLVKLVSKPVFKQ